MSHLNLTWNLNELLAPFGLGSFDVEVNALSQDSRESQDGSLFIARQGAKYSGVEFAMQAASKGAKAILLEGSEESAQLLKAELQEQGYLTPVMAWDNEALSLSALADRFYHSPSRAMVVVGVTGTNGKTSTAHFMVQLLTAMGEKAALLGTIGIGFLGQLESSSHTTLEPVLLQRTLATLRSEGATHVVMEVSSHAIDQGRIDQVAFDLVGYTNLTRDHLDYHGTMDAYAAAKARLFRDYAVPLQIVNADDLVVQELLDESTEQQRVGFSTTNQSSWAYLASQVFRPDGLSLEFSLAGETTQLDVPLMGSFNVANLLLAVASLKLLGFEANDIERAALQLKSVPGRMELIEVKQGPIVIVDYAHTPDALEKALLACREHLKDGAISVLFGCGGDRDQGKRPLMAQVAASHADSVWVTSDNPRTENPQAIVDQIMTGFASQDSVQQVLGRADAIDLAIAAANEGDIVLLAGKGHEDYQEINGERLPFSDQAQARRALAAGGWL